MPALGGDQLLAVALVATVAGLGLGLLFGFGRRTLGIAALIAIAAHALHPGGARGLVVDALRPFRSLTDTTGGQRDARSAAIDEATGSGDVTR